MLPGPDQPAEPSQPQAPTGYAQSLIRPRRGWYALAIMLVLGGWFTMIGVYAANYQGINAADRPAVFGDARQGIFVKKLTAGHTYFLFMPVGSPEPASCTVSGGRLATEDVHEPVTLTKKKGHAAVQPAPGYGHAAGFQAPFSGPAVLTCRGGAGNTWVAPDNSPVVHVIIASVVGLCVMLPGAVAGFVMKRKRLSSRRALGLSPGFR